MLYFQDTARENIMVVETHSFLKDLRIRPQVNNRHQSFPNHGEHSIPNLWKEPKVHRSPSHHGKVFLVHMVGEELMAYDAVDRTTTVHQTVEAALVVQRLHQGALPGLVTSLDEDQFAAEGVARVVGH